MSTIDLQELEEFNEMIDNLIDDIESGKVTSNPLAPTKKQISEIDGKGIKLEETTTELGEDSVIVQEDDIVEQNSVPETDAVITISNKTCTNFHVTGEIIGTPSKLLVVLTKPNGVEVIFGNAAIAAREVGLNPTTVRERCNKEYVDGNNNTWSYRKND